MTDNGTETPDAEKPETEKVISMTGEAIPKKADEPDIPESARKELKTLIWVGIVSIWLCLIIVVMLAFANGKNMRNSSDMAKQLTVIGEEVPAIKSELSSVSTEVPNIKTELTASSQNNAEKLFAGQAAMSEKLLSGQAAMSEKLLAEMEKANQAFEKILATKLSENGQQVNESVVKILAEQQKVLQEIDNLHNSDRMTLLRKFIENQTVMLNQLNQAMETPEAEKKE